MWGCGGLPPPFSRARLASPAVDFVAARPRVYTHPIRNCAGAMLPWFVNIFANLRLAAAFGEFPPRQFVASRSFTPAQYVSPTQLKISRSANPDNSAANTVTRRQRPLSTSLSSANCPSNRAKINRQPRGLETRISHREQTTTTQINRQLSATSQIRSSRTAKIIKTRDFPFSICQFPPFVKMSP